VCVCVCIGVYPHYTHTHTHTHTHIHTRTQALWSDPSDSDAEMANGVHANTARGDRFAPKAALFGPDITASFCKRNTLQLVIRSHQFVREGVKFMHGIPQNLLYMSLQNYFTHSSRSDHT